MPLKYEKSSEIYIKSDMYYC